MEVTAEELRYRQSWNLDQKIDHTLGAIEQFYNYTNGQCYISFSGGKDSTVLLHIARRLYPNMKAMFILTGNEYPEIAKFVRSVENVDIVRPMISFKNVIAKYGFPLISKEQAQYLHDAKYSKSEKLKDIRMNGRVGKRSQGMVSKKWQFMINAPFDVSEECCHYLKKKPARDYEKLTGLMPIIGTMASESTLRTQKYQKTSCNVLDGKKSASYPLSIWNDEDVWLYIKKYKIDYCELYDKGFDRTGCMVCGFGLHYDPSRMSRLKELHEKAFNSFMAYENNGIRFDDAINFTFNGPQRIQTSVRMY
jgi:3'-phosphoadenosine 5'-phosphosulfate sulfotransferase (PAPS reductase)/FAD synthetase